MNNLKINQHHNVNHEIKLFVIIAQENVYVVEKINE